MSAPRSRVDIEALRAALSDPRDVCARLNLLEGSKRQGGGLLVRCPAHPDRDASCSVTTGPDRTLRVRCFACEFSGDVLHLVAAVEGLDVARQFGAVLWRAAELAGVDIDRAVIDRALRPPPPPAPPKPPPPAVEVAALWAACRPAASDEGVAAWLRGRALDPAIVTRLDLVRALPLDVVAPRWASYRGELPAPASWASLGYRAIVPMFDAAGELASVRARLVALSRGDVPKALPPSGHGTKGLVMACPLAAMMLACGGWPHWSERRVVVVEGEPDFLSRATHGTIPRTAAVLGLGGSGQWTEELAARIPDDSTVILRTDADDAGDAYAAEIAATLRGRCEEVRETDGDGRALRRRARAERDAERRRRGSQQVGIPGVAQ